MLITMKYFKEAVKFLEGIKNTDETVIVFNNDGDGICSCTIIMKLLKETGKRAPYIISQPMPMDKNIVQRVKTTAPNKIIFLDLVVDQQEDVVKKLRGFADIMIIDHHQILRDLNNKNIVHFNPRFSDPNIYTSTTYNAYKVCSAIKDMEEHLWVAGIGMVSDYNLDDSKDIVALVGKKYCVTDDLYKSFIGRIADMIFSARATKDLSCEQMTELFTKADGIEKLKEMDNYKKMEHAFYLIEEEINSILEDARINARKDGNLIIYNTKSKYNLNSIISTKISEKNLDRLVMVYSKNGARYKVSARNQKKNINAGNIMKSATNGLKASGGGHEAAAGATVDEKDWDKFIERVTELANKK